MCSLETLKLLSVQIILGEGWFTRHLLVAKQLYNSKYPTVPTFIRQVIRQLFSGGNVFYLAATQDKRLIILAKTPMSI